MWRAGTWYVPYSMYMYVYTGHLLCGGQALGTYLIVCICMYIQGTCCRGQALGTHLIVCNVYCINVHKVILEFVLLAMFPCLRPLVLEIAEVFQRP